MGGKGLATAGEMEESKNIWMNGRRMTILAGKCMRKEEREAWTGGETERKNELKQTDIVI